MGSPHSVFLVDDHIVVRNGIKALIEHSPEYRVTREYDNGRQLVDDIPFEKKPDIILLDIGMPVMDGKATMEWMNTHDLNHPVLILTLDASDKSIIELFRLGVRGYLPKTCTAEILNRAISDVIDTGYYHNELLPNALLANESANRKDERKKIIEKISDKEMIFLHLVCDPEEYTYEQIADKLHIHRRTVDGYRESLFDKFNIKSKTGLVLFAIKYKLIEQQ